MYFKENQDVAKRKKKSGLEALEGGGPGLASQTVDGARGAGVTNGELELNAGAWLSFIEWSAMVVGIRYLQSKSLGPLKCLVPKHEDSSSSPGIHIKTAVNASLCL